jgi:hypothetical protein
MKSFVLALILLGFLTTYSVSANAPVEPQPDPCADQSAAAPIPQPFEQAVYMPLVVN